MRQLLAKVSIQWMANRFNGSLGGHKRPFAHRRSDTLYASGRGCCPEGSHWFGETVCFTPQNIVEFWNVCTRPLDRNGLGLSPQEAEAAAARLEALLKLLPDNPSIYPEWRRLVATYNVSGVQVHDARLVAVMNVYDVDNIVTFNGRDFSRYPRIRAVHPQDLFRPDSTN